MIESWVMVFFTCTGSCTAVYAEPYISYRACVKNLPVQEGKVVTEKYICLPVSKD